MSTLDPSPPKVIEKVSELKLIIITSFITLKIITNCHMNPFIGLLWLQN